MTYSELSRKLRALGCVLRRQGKGSHGIWHNPLVNRSAVIPNHPGDIPVGTPASEPASIWPTMSSWSAPMPEPIGAAVDKTATDEERRGRARDLPLIDRGPGFEEAEAYWRAARTSPRL